MRQWRSKEVAHQDGDRAPGTRGGRAAGGLADYPGLFVVENEAAFLRTKIRLRPLPVSLRHLGRAGTRRNPRGHFQRRLSAIIAQPRSILSLPAYSGESVEVQ